MGRLRHTSSGRTAELRASHGVGRHPSQDLVLAGANDAVSQYHASLTWKDVGWVLRDLGSTNGTFCEGEAMAPGVDRAVRRGSILQFGTTEEVWEVVDEAPPRPFAVASDGREVAGDLDILLVPADGHPAVVHRAPEGGWALERGGEPTPVDDGAVLDADGVRWRLHLPRVVPTTKVSSSVGGWRLELTAFASTGGVRAVVVHPGGRADLGLSVNHGVLDVLARERLRDERRGVGAGAAGWCLIGDLALALGIPAATVYTRVHRLRSQLRACGLADGAPVLESRGHAEIRVGVLVHRSEA